MGKLYLFNVYTFWKSLCVINVGSPYYHGDPIYILYLNDHMWLVGTLKLDLYGHELELFLFNFINYIILFCCGIKSSNFSIYI